MELKIDAPVLVIKNGNWEPHPSQIIIRSKGEDIHIDSHNNTMVIDKEQARLIAQFLLTISK